MIIRNAQVNDCEAITELCDKELDYQIDRSLVKSQFRLNSGVERVAAHRFYEKIGYEHNKNQAHYGKII